MQNEFFPLRIHPGPADFHRTLGPLFSMQETECRFLGCVRFNCRFHVNSTSKRAYTPSRCRAEFCPGGDKPWVCTFTPARNTMPKIMTDDHKSTDQSVQSCYTCYTCYLQTMLRIMQLRLIHNFSCTEGIKNRPKLRAGLCGRLLSKDSG